MLDFTRTIRLHGAMQVTLATKQPCPEQQRHGSQQMRDRLGVIDSLSAGYRFLGRRLELLLIPILLDLLFWLGPRLSIAPLFKQAADFYAQAANLKGMPTDMVALTQQMADTLTQLGQQSNLLGVLANSSLLHVPSLLAGSAPLNTQVVVVQSPLAAILLLIAFSLLGVLLGVVYMNMLARVLPIGDGPKPATIGEFVGVVARHWLMVLLYVALVLVALLVGSIPITLAVALLTVVSPLIGSLALMLFSGTLLVLFFYLYFVSAALIMDNLPVHRAIMQSFVLVRNNFWATLAFVVLYNVIVLGFAFLMAGLAALTPIGTIMAIVAYAYIGTGLTMALLVFYRTRVLKRDEKLVSVA